MSLGILRNFHFYGGEDSREKNSWFMNFNEMNKLNKI